MKKLHSMSIATFATILGSTTLFACESDEVVSEDGVPPGGARIRNEVLCAEHFGAWVDNGDGTMVCKASSGVEIFVDASTVVPETTEIPQAK